MRIIKSLINSINNYKNILFAAILILSTESIVSIFQIYFQKEIIDSIIQNELIYMFNFFLLYILSSLILCWTFFESGIILHELEYKISGKLYDDLLNAILNLKFTDYFKKTFSEYLIYFRDIEQISNLLFNLFFEVFTCIKFLIVFFAITYISKRVSLIIIPFVLFHFAITKFIHDKSYKFSKKQLSEEVNYIQNIKDHVEGTREIISNDSFDWTNQQIKHTFKVYLLHVYDMLKINILKIIFSDSLKWLLAGIIVFGSISYSTNIVISSGSVLMIYQLTNILLNEYFKLAKNIMDWPKKRYMLDRISWIYDNSDHFNEINTYLDTDIFVDNLTYTHPETLKNIFSNVSFSIKKGDTMLIEGASGSGKTTMLKLLTKQLLSTNGCIYYGDKNITNISEYQLTNSISYVFQEPKIINGTIRENILLGLDIQTETQIHDICKIVNLTEFVNNQDAGLETVIGDNGLNISGGERQRIALARALIQNKPILILDEAMTALDIHTESDIVEKLLHFRKGKTTIIVAHRGNLIKNATNIFTINDKEEFVNV